MEMKDLLKLKIVTNFSEKQLKLLKYLSINIFLLVLPFISDNQLITGSIVNALIIYLAINYKRSIIPAIFIPSIATLFKGLIFGSFTIYLVYYLPIIWFSNYILIYVIKFLVSKKLNNIISITLAVILKFLILFFVTLIYINVLKLPNIFLNAMGFLQLITGIIGMIIFVIISKIN